MKRIFYTAGTLLLLVFLLRFPEEALCASRDGLNLWLNTLLPTLLPFIILTGILIHTGMVEKLLKPLSPVWSHIFGISPSGAYALLLGLLCGYPMGAKITSDLYGCGRISKREAEYLLTFTNHASPVFIYTYLIHTCLNDRFHPWLIYGPLLLSSCLTMIFFRFFVYRNRTRTPDTFFSEKNKEPSAPGVTGTLLDASIMNGFETITRLGGYILLFSILSAFVRHYWNAGEMTEYLFLGALELTTGLHQLARSGFSPVLRYLCSMPMAAFGGVCILAQTKSLLHKELSVLPYISAKCLNAAITAISALVFLKVV